MPRYTLKWVESVEYYTEVEAPNPKEAMESFYNGGPIGSVETEGAEMEPDSLQVFEENSKEPIDMTAP